LYFFCHVVLASAWDDKFQNFGKLHNTICTFLDGRLRPSRRKYLSVFRGSYKTTVLLGFAIWLFVWAIATGKPISIVYNTGTKENAEAFMDDFRETLLNAKLLHWIFPMLPKSESEFRKYTKQKVEFKSAKFHVASLDTKQVSRHYTVILNDDLVNDKNAYSETEREKVINQWRYQKSILTRYVRLGVGLEVDTGTPYHSRDLMSFIRDKVNTYDKLIVPYALQDGRGRVDPKRENGILTFPEMFSWEDYRTIREDQGASIFATQYGLETLEEADTLCKAEWIRHWKTLPEVYKRVMIVDPAGVETKKTSATGINISDIDPLGTLYVVHSNKYWVTPTGLIELMVQLERDFKPDEQYVEKEKYSVTIADTKGHLAPTLHFSFVETHGVPKPSRIFRLKQWLETGRILLGQGQESLEDRLTTYQGEMEDTDELDPLAYQLQVMNPPKKHGGRIRSEEEQHEDRFLNELSRIKAVFAGGGNYDQLF
jgi:hypothetical protein